jgi:hypothetical protein
LLATDIESGDAPALCSDLICDRHNLQDRRKPTIQLDQEPAIMVGEPDATWQPAPHDIQLMSKHRVLSFKPQLRLEWRGQDGQNETEQSDHSASLSDSITASTQIRFSVHTISRIRAPLTIHGSGETRRQGAQTSRFVQMFQRRWRVSPMKPPGQLGGFFLASIVIEWAGTNGHGDCWMR